MHKCLILALAALLLAAEASAQGSYDDVYGELAEAKRAYELIDTRDPKDDKQAAVTTLIYGERLLRVFELKESRRILKRALRRYEDLYGKDSVELIPVLGLLAQADVSHPQSQPNQRYLKRARKIALEELDNTSIDFADSMLAIGQLSLMQVTFMHAVPFQDPPREPPADIAGKDLHLAYQVYVAKLDSNSMRIGAAEFALGLFYLARNERDEALPHLQAALRIFDPSDAARRELHIAVRAQWGGWLESNGLRDEATIHYVAVGKLLESAPNQNMLPLYRMAPSYPPGPLRAGISGYVEWKFTVDESGYVIDPEAIQIVGSEDFREEALRAILQFRYPPRFIDGVAVAQPGVTNRISFMLRD